jgi:hypothetical protein
VNIIRHPTASLANVIAKRFIPDNNRLLSKLQFRASACPFPINFFVEPFFLPFQNIFLNQN